jgi:hypothetical protein
MKKAIGLSYVAPHYIEIEFNLEALGKIGVGNFYKVPKSHVVLRKCTAIELLGTYSESMIYKAPPGPHVMIVAKIL